MNSEAGGTEGKFTMSQSAIATSIVQRNNKKQIMIRTDSDTEAWVANEAAPYKEAEKVKQSRTTTNSDLSLVLMPHNRVED
ncbi:MAG: hypothetical protein HUJ56_04930 [Erysipelotrichaceae bacterium]|nr:hypothetical protein [Erysipelotrichaceae bacterium]